MACIHAFPQFEPRALVKIRTPTKVMQTTCNSYTLATSGSLLAAV